MRTRNLPPRPGAACGACAVPLVGPGAGPHPARALCGSCGRFLQWLPKVLFAGKEPRRMGSIARCIVLGVVSKHGVEVRYASSGAPCVSLTLVVTEQGQDGRPHDLFVPVEVWGRRAEAVSELVPGQSCTTRRAGSLMKAPRGGQRRGERA
jgi:hypothetical protein